LFPALSTTSTFRPGGREVEEIAVIVTALPTDNQGADPVSGVPAPETLYGVSYLARQLGISRGYVSFLVRRRILPFLPTHVFLGDAGTRSQALFTAERLATILHCYNAQEEEDRAALAGTAVLLYGVTYLAQLLGYSRTWISPLVRERVAPFCPTHELAREDGSAGSALFTAERLQHIVAVRREQALQRRYPGTGGTPLVAALLRGTEPAPVGY
jgi:hypothetical protein